MLGLCLGGGEMGVMNVQRGLAIIYTSAGRQRQRCILAQLGLFCSFCLLPSFCLWLEAFIAPELLLGWRAGRYWNCRADLPIALHEAS